MKVTGSLAQPLPQPGGPGDFRALYDAEFSFVWRCLGALGVPPAALDDATQEVFLVVHRKLAEFRGDSSLRTWLYAIVRNVARNTRRTARRKHATELLSGSEACEQPGPFERLHGRDMARALYAFVDKLDSDLRDLFVLAILEQVPMQDVAVVVGIPLNTAYTRVRMLKQDLARTLQPPRGRS